MIYFFGFFAGALVFGAGCFVGAALACMVQQSDSQRLPKPPLDAYDDNIINFDPKPRK